MLLPPFGRLRLSPCQELVPALTGFRYVPGVKGNPAALGSKVGLVYREVAPPLAVVIPDVMVGVIPIDRDR